MASVYRKTVTHPLPSGAEIITRKGEQLVKWTTKRGKQRTGVYFANKAGQPRVRIESATYIAKYRDGSGQLQEVSTGCRSKDAALAVLAQLTSRAENVKSGVVSAADDRVRDWLADPIAEILADYLAALKAKDNSAVHLRDCRRLCERLFAECGFAALRDIRPEAIERWLAARSAEGLSPRTRNSYLQAMRGFCRWCVQAGRLASDPTKRIGKAAEQVDIRRQRRAMTGEELQRLLYVATWRPLAEFGRQSIACDETERNGKRSNWTKTPLTFDTLSEALDRARHTLKDNPQLIAELEARGRERALVYKALVLTGLRRGELASLTVGSLQIDGPQAFATLEAGSAKNRQRAEIPLRSDLAADLRQWIGEKREAFYGAARGSGVVSIASGKAVDLPSDTPLLHVPQQLVKALDRDLAAAGIKKRDDRGRTLDVHSLRHSFGTLLSAGGVTPRVAQSAMRHSDIGLTMNTYTDPRLLDVGAALDALPALPLDGSPMTERQQAKATGTDDRHATDPRGADASGVVNKRRYSVAPLVAPDSDIPSTPETIQGNWASSSDSPQKRENPGKTSGFPGFQGAHPAGVEPATFGFVVRSSTPDNSLDGNDLGQSDNSRCTTGCTSFPVSLHAETLEGLAAAIAETLSGDDLRRLVGLLNAGLANDDGRIEWG